MDRLVFRCIFANEIRAYLNNKVSSGYQEKSFYYHMKNFDRFCIGHALTTPVFTRELADEWLKRRKGEATTTHYSRINAIKQFLIYLNKKGYDVFVTRDISFKQTQFQPHIYTKNECFLFQEYRVTWKNESDCSKQATEKPCQRRI